MKIQVTGSSTPAHISFDYYGNAYFEHNNKEYQLGVDGRNKLQLTHGDYHIIEKIKKVKKMTPSNGKPFKQLVREEYEEHDSNDEGFDDQILKEDDDYW
jgi:hypothetical protein